MKSNSIKAYVLNIVLKSLLTATLVASASTASAATLFQDDFTRANNNTVGNGWSELSDNANDVAIVGNRVRLRDNLPGSPDGAIGSSVIDATGYENITVSFTWQSLNPNEGNDLLRLSYGLDPAPALTNEAAWNQVFQVNDAGTTVTNSSVTVGALDNSEFSLMFWTVLNGNGNTNEGFFLDNVVVTGDLIPAVPLPAGAPLLLLGLGGFAALRRRK